ncbi:MAG: thiol peroxidase [Candidatus Omnitrophica bacterium]|nr:thiol peroxidase [Candidatus Omnitrophota bacterium]
MAAATLSAPAPERQGAVKFKGTPLTLVGPELKVGAKAPEFQALAQDLSPVTLANFKGKTLLLSVTPSLDTPVCDAQVKRFNEEAVKLAGVEIANISMDLPFAQKRWCGASNVNRVTTLSDHKDASFGTAYGVLIKELRLLTRAVFLLDRAGVIRYAEYVPEMSAHPNYDAALAAVRQLAK